jgi:cation diffusion facilitator CzcD-associated flavoprotein CzcO
MMSCAQDGAVDGRSLRGGDLIEEEPPVSESLTPAAPAAQPVHAAIIIGAGFGGLGAGAQLARRGIDDFLIIERAGDIGGVWRDNTYPGAACDTQAIVYCYTFFPHLDVDRMFADGSELVRYLRALVARFDLQRRITLNTEVEAAEWAEDLRAWRVTTASGEQHLGRVLIPAWGHLGVPSVPAIPGFESFEGSAFHSAVWDHSVDLTGKRVVSIGAAASAVQYVPFVAEQAEKLTVLQRSANYILPRNQKIFSEEERKGFHDDPETFETLRREIHEMREAGFARVRHATGEQAIGVAEARAHLEAQVADPELREKLTPDYEFGCKRILRSDDYYPAISRSNVDLVTEPISHVTAGSVVTMDGVEHGADVIIFGTGFRSQAFQGDTRIIGRHGVDLADRWGDAPQAYLGMTVDGFPNMFLVYGPNTNLNHNSVVTMMEIQQEFIADTTTRILSDDSLVFDALPSVVSAYDDHVQNELEKSAYSSDCSSWYKNAAGRVVNNWYGTVEEYRRTVASARPVDFGLAPDPSMSVTS